jgi:hypothetical protein
MKTTIPRLFVTSGLAVFLASSNVRGQGTFQNLDFESINPNVLQSQPPNFVSFANALPDWTGYWGTDVATQAMVNGISVGGVIITVVTPFGAYSSAVIDGNATVTLDSGANPSVTAQVPAAIAQTGVISPGTRSLRFSLGSASDADFLSVALNRQSIPIYPLQSGPNYTVYGANVSAFADSTAELRFTEMPDLSSSHPWTFAYLDDIQFSDLPIPEPSALGLFGLGALLLGCWRRKCSA